jgi:hypothetical protein
MANRADRFDDKYELVLASGLLSREDPQYRRLFRHVITRRIFIRLETDASLTVTLDANTPARLEDREFLGAEDGYSADRSAGLRDELDDQDLPPQGEETWATLQRWAALSFAQGVHPSSSWHKPIASQLSLTHAPAVILRERSGDALQRYYASIAVTLSSPGAVAPPGLAQLVAPTTAEERLFSVADASQHGLAADEQLLPLATNKAQRRVLQRMNVDSAVVVEGPPGTGKTHTIANLVCALLAQGQRVLVTSQREQALRELRDKLPEPVRDLCVMSTAARSDGTDDFSRSVTALSEMFGSTTQAEEEEIIREATIRRNSLIADASRLRDGILRLRTAEWIEYPEVARGYSGTLPTIAERVAAQAPRLGWLHELSSSLPAPLGDPPLSAAEAADLRALLSQETPSRCARRAQRFPEAEAVPEADSFQQVLSAARRADETARQAGGTAQEIAAVDGSTVFVIEGQVRAAAAASRRLKLPVRVTDWPASSWEPAALSAMFARHHLDLLRDIDIAAAEVEEGLGRIQRLGRQQVSVPQLPHGDFTEMLSAVASLRRRRAGRGLVSRMTVTREQRSAQRFLSSCRVDGHEPSSESDIDAVLTWLQVTAVVNVHLARWAPFKVTPRQGASMLVLVSSLAACYRRLRDLETIAKAHDSVVELLANQGIRPHGSATLAGWDALCDDIATGSALAVAQQGRRAPARFASRLPQATSADPPELAELRRTALAQDVPGYRQARTKLQHAFTEWRDQQRCDDLLKRLRQWHPRVADELAQTSLDEAWEEKLRSLPEACQWLTAKAFCERALDSSNDQELQAMLDETELHISEETARLVAARTRLCLLCKVSPEQRQALEAYRAAVAAIGKGKGRYTATKRRAARSAMRAAQGAVPAWIMPVGKVAETIPPVKDSFDVVIVDEASQLELGALFLLWLAPRVIAVGDDKQCAPGWPGTDNQRYLDMLRQSLPTLDHHERLALEPGGNLYALLLQRFPDPVRLTEHFRSMPEIIGWSSRQFYDERLLPFRQFTPDRLPPLHVVHVEDGRAEGRGDAIHNDSEAKHLVEKLQELLADAAYTSPRARSFGIIALQGTGQAKRIDRMINASIEPMLRTRHNIRVGNPPDFQGSEYDVVLLSMVASRAFTARTGLRNARLFNVAASRARDQMWLFTSMTRDRLNPEDLRFSLLTYMEDPPTYLGEPPSLDEVSADIRQPPFESLFQQHVFRAIRQRGYHVVPQVKVGRDYSLDLVVTGDNARLAIACDGPIARAPVARVQRDFDWERDLRRVAWRFWRIRQSEFTLAPERTLDALWTELADLGISPNAAVTTVGTASSSWSAISLSDEEDDQENGGANP